MARQTRGMLYKKGKAGTYYLEYYVNGKRFKQSLRVTTLEEAEKERDRILLPVLAGDVVEKRKAVVHALADAQEQKVIADEANREKLPLTEVWSR